MAITRRQKEVLDFIAAYQVENGYSPSYEEIARGLKLASSPLCTSTFPRSKRRIIYSAAIIRAALSMLSPRICRSSGAIVWKRHLKFRAGHDRGGPTGRGYMKNAPGEFRRFRSQKDTYALRVRGNSMVEDHICEGDMVLVENTVEAHEGDIVVALVDGRDTTLKRYYHEPGNMIRLRQRIGL